MNFTHVDLVVSRDIANLFAVSEVKGNAIGAGGLGFDSRAAQTGHSVDSGSPPLRRFFGAVAQALRWAS